MPLPAKTRVAATALSFALCFVYLLFLPFHAWGLAALIALSTLLLTSLGQSDDVGVAAITTGAVMVIPCEGSVLTRVASVPDRLARRGIECGFS